MNRSLLRPAAAIATALFLLSSAPAQEQAGDKVDLDVLAKIKSQAYDHSQVMENLYSISEVYGPRVNNSRNHRAAAEWAVTQLKAWGLQNVHLEKFDFGYGWQIKKFYAAMEAPAYAALIGFPLAWTPGTNGPITADAMYAPIHSKDDFAKYHGKLKGKIVLMFDPPHLLLHTTQDATKSPTDEEILARANAPRGGAAPAGRGAAPGGPPPAVEAESTKEHGSTPRPPSPSQTRRTTISATRSTPTSMTKPPQSS